MFKIFSQFSCWKHDKKKTFQHQQRSSLGFASSLYNTPNWFPQVTQILHLGWSSVFTIHGFLNVRLDSADKHFVGNVVSLFMKNFFSDFFLSSISFGKVRLHSTEQYYDSTGFVEWTWQCYLTLHTIEQFESCWYWTFLNTMIEFSSQSTYSGGILITALISLLIHYLSFLTCVYMCGWWNPGHCWCWSSICLLRPGCLKESWIGYLIPH